MVTYDALSILKADLLPEYLEQINASVINDFDALEEAEISTENFSFYTSVSSVYSSKIEGEEIELDSYIKHKKFGVELLPDYTKKIDDLYDAYIFAKTENISSQSISEAHKILTRHILSKSQQGRFRAQKMYVSTADGRIEYVAASPFEVSSEMGKLYQDISYLLKCEMSIREVLFFASFIHLVFVKIHPWNDGNGRFARLLEKWFLAQKLGEKAWLIQSEKQYYSMHQTYYTNLRMLGLEYAELDYANALPFLLMLPKALITSKQGKV